ncbi:MAG TPA: carboxypeptidase regulatory-like domain-containing protein [Longimicrobiales bacterium]|nr:carboxypeptidase regulatory-like domain-containing protein [Longimicrobiales bacterium]
MLQSLIRRAARARIAVLAMSPFWAPSHGLAAQQPSVHGVVVDEGTWTPVEAAVVSLAGTALRTTSRADGTFTIEGAPVGPATIRVEAPGFPTMVQQIDVRRGVLVYVQFIMPRMDAFLDELLVVGARQGLDVSEPRTAADFLVGEVPGILRNEGMVGRTESRLRLRGVSSITLHQDPVVYLDGVRLAGSVSEALAVLSQIPATEVESVEVLRGPAAAFLHGAADGVIHVRTKTGGR